MLLRNPSVSITDKWVNGTWQMLPEEMDSSGPSMSLLSPTWMHDNCGVNEDYGSVQPLRCSFTRHAQEAGAGFAESHKMSLSCTCFLFSLPRIPFIQSLHPVTRLAR